MFSKLFASRTFRLQHVRRILTDCKSAYPVISVKDARKELQELVGSAKSWDAQRDQSVFDIALPKSQSELPVKSMKDSFRETCIPLGTNERLRETYINWSNTIRIGRIMEDLDSTAVLIGYSHCAQENKEKSPICIVTGMVDRIDRDPDNIIYPDRDLHLKGHVTWAGSTSLEVSMFVEQENPNGNGVSKILEAQFLMVARDPHNRGKAFVNPLQASTPEEEALLRRGEENKIQRELERKADLLRHPPSEKEKMLVHNMFLDTLDSKRHTFKSRVKPENAVWMEESLLKNIIICFPEQRNLYNKIFGGFLMRQAFELGWVNASVFSKHHVHTVAMDDIMFQKPVEVGSLLYLSSQVIYTYGPYMQVKVHAEVVKPETGEQETTNIFHYTFTTKEPDVPQIVPKSYAEYMMYLAGKRHFESGKLAKMLVN